MPETARHAFRSLLATSALFLLPFLLVPAPAVLADELDSAAGEIIQDFQRHIGAPVEGRKYYVVVRSFVDQDSSKPTKICREVEDALVEQILDRFADRKDIVVLDRTRVEALEKEVAFEADRTRFSTDEWTKKMGKKLGAGYLITGTVSKQARHVKIRAKMIDIVTSQVVASASSNVGIEDLDPGVLSDYPRDKEAETPAETPAAKPAPKKKSGKSKPATVEEEEDETPPPAPSRSRKSGASTPQPAPQPSQPSYPESSPWPAQQYPQQPVAAIFCCDMWGNRRCQLVAPVAAGTSCFCPGQGYGVSCP